MIYSQCILIEFVKINILELFANWQIDIIFKDKEDKFVRIYFYIWDKFEELQFLLWKD